MAQTVQSLFGLTPEQIQAQRAAEVDARALQYAQMDPFQRAEYGIFRGASQLGDVLAQRLGYVDPLVKQAEERKGLLSGMSITDPNSLREAAQKAWQGGQFDIAQTLFNQAQELELKGAQTRKASMEAGKVEAEAAREAKMQEELNNLPENASEEQILAIYRKYASPDKALSAIQTSMDRAAARQAALENKQAEIAARIQIAQMQGATAQMIAQMQIEGRKEMAALAAQFSPAAFKRQEEAMKAEEGQKGLEGTLDRMGTLVTQLAESGGMTSTTAPALKNLGAAFEASGLGQWAGSKTGTENQARRDELASLRLQLLNDIKAATGMSSQQLNSNVELQTWLTSLGDPKLTKEANEAILKNIKQRFLQKTSGKEDPLGLR